MNKIKSHFKFNKQERSGIFFLLLIICILQGIYYYVKTQPYQKGSNLALNTIAQSKLDSLKNQKQEKTSKVFPFNPNYITDYKGYSLGMSTEQIDRLLAYRQQHKYVNSAKEFQMVTKVSDSLLSIISPFFQFPKWKNRTPSKEYGSFTPNGSEFVKKDLNTASGTELKAIHGVGDVLSRRIVKFRDRLGGFLVNDQLYDVYGLEPEVVQRILIRFEVITIPTIKKINVNEASVMELSALLYINYDLAQQIVAYRTANGSFESLDELKEVENFPENRIGRIKLYLQL
ncbi:helix-hairpin-helix domain-containing protein [Muricauda sp. JGD-17]|uniref:Helix-hairpin-helix domain-containing protein n=1 Tax=Flagellimonas ochracea TaxID=2696472 RepID=A0A964WXV4_9FLAO|nr:helix-hairpin-helix domain-containing protein [Allomuricauda ochracea]NAY92546.1 helix-hairpin-helix domain-containing protein [Allomuricauda ochracea]